VDAARRRDLARYGAPAAFLAAVTIAVLLIKSGLGGGHGATTGQALPTTTPTTTAPAKTTTVVARYYTVQPGDTLGAIAIRERTTVDRLMHLNPGVDPRSLHSGQRIRIS
jgi:LysM repeat protein